MIKDLSKTPAKDIPDGFVYIIVRVKIPQVNDIVEFLTKEIRDVAIIIQNERPMSFGDDN